MTEDQLRRLRAKLFYESASWQAWVELGYVRGFWRRLGLWFRFLTY